MDHLIRSELARLSPDVFDHPLWYGYIQAQPAGSTALIDDLRQQAQLLDTRGDTASACQVLFLCAALEKLAGDYPGALAFILQAGALAEQHHLEQPAGWAAWGACALCTAQAQYERAAGYLHQLRQNVGQYGSSWVLADILEVLESALADKAIDAPVLEPVLDWLQAWGEPAAKIGIVPHLSETSQSRCPQKQACGQNQPGFASFTARLRALLSILAGICSGKVHVKLVIEDGTTLGQAGPPLSRRAFNSSEPGKPGIQPAVETSPPALSAVETRFFDLPAPDLDQAGEDADLLAVYCLGNFRASYHQKTIETWPSRKGLAIFKYLVTNHQVPVSKDILMDTFWPEADPESARNRLNVAMHALRQALRPRLELPVIQFEADSYQINPAIKLWLDKDEFENHIKTARKMQAANQVTAAMQELRLAASLYQGDFLQDDPYEDWPVVIRERLRVFYLETLDVLSKFDFDQGDYEACIYRCQLTLERDNCREDTYRLLIRSYSRLGQPLQALRQYQVCKDTLRKELDVDPEPATLQLAERVRRREPV